MKAIWLCELPSGYILTSIINISGCNSVSGNSFLLLSMYFSEKAEMTNDNRQRIEVKCAINCYQHWDFPHNLEKKKGNEYSIYKDLIFLNIFSLECINLKIKSLNILINYSALKNTHHWSNILHALYEWFNIMMIILKAAGKMRRLSYIHETGFIALMSCNCQSGFLEGYNK